MSQQVNAEDKRRAELKQIVDHFRGKTVNQNVLNEFCNRNKLEPMEVGSFEDLVFQADHDDKMALLVPEIIKELANLQVEPSLVSQAELKRIDENNDNVRIAIVKLIEKHGISELMLERLGGTLKDILGSPVEMAGTTVYNKSRTVMRDIVKGKLGLTNINQFSSKHIAQYVEDVDKEYAKKVKDSGTKDAGGGEPTV